MVLGSVAKMRLMIFLVLAICLALCGVEVQAQPTDLDRINLVLGGEGSTSWIIEDIMPCHSGIKTVTLHNAGTEDGYVTIWISDIVSSEGATPESETDTAGPGELDDYLLFDLSSDGELNTGLVLPTLLTNFPQSINDPNIITIPLDSGATVTMDWHWELPCETGNDAQGDILSFNINYLLEDLILPLSPAGLGAGAGGGECYLKIDMLGEITFVRVACCSNRVLKDYEPSDPGNMHSMVIENRTRITCGDTPKCGNYPRIVVMTLADEAPAPPPGMVIVGPVYDITGYMDVHWQDPGCPKCPSVTFGSHIAMVISYDPRDVPENAISIVLAYYDDELEEWVELPPELGIVAEVGKLRAFVGRFSSVAVLAELPPQAPSAVFTISTLWISPSEVEIGETVTISMLVANTGNAAGSYEVLLKINGVVEATKNVTLGLDASEEITFATSKDEAGNYSVDINGLTGSFTVKEAVPPSPPPSEVNWVILGPIIGVAVFLAVFLSIRRRRRGVLR